MATAPATKGRKEPQAGTSWDVGENFSNTKSKKGLGRTNDHFDAPFFSQSYNPHPAMFAVQGTQGASVAASRTTKSYIFLDAPGSGAGSGAGVGFAPALARRRPLAPASSEDKENMAPAS